MSFILVSRFADAAARRADALTMGNNRFIRLVKLLLPSGRFANLLGMEK
jgi:hypothetical protein